MKHHARINAARLKLGWSIRRLAREAGIDATQLCRILNGQCGMTVTTMEKIDNALKGATDDRK